MGAYAYKRERAIRKKICIKPDQRLLSEPQRIFNEHLPPRVHNQRLGILLNTFFRSRNDEENEQIPCKTGTRILEHPEFIEKSCVAERSSYKYSVRNSHHAIFTVQLNCIYRI